MVSLLIVSSIGLVHHSGSHSSRYFDDISSLLVWLPCVGWPVTKVVEGGTQRRRRIRCTDGTPTLQLSTSTSRMTNYQCSCSTGNLRSGLPQLRGNGSSVLPLSYPS